MNLEARTIDCQRNEMNYQVIYCQRRNMKLPRNNVDPQRKRINSPRRSIIDHQKRNMDCKINEENIYSEPVFDDDSTYEDQRMTDHGDRNVSNQKLNNKSRMKVLEPIPPNYVILIPKNHHGECVIPCTIVPREMVANMLHVHREGAEEETYQKTRKNTETNYKDDRIEHFSTVSKSSNDMTAEKTPSDEKEEDDYIEYSSGNAGYTEPVYEEHIEHGKYNQALANFISETSLDIRNSPEYRRKHQPKRSPSKVSIFLESVLGSPLHNKKKLNCRRSNTRQTESEYETFELDDRRTSDLMDRQLKHNMGIMGL